MCLCPVSGEGSMAQEEFDPLCVCVLFQGKEAWHRKSLTPYVFVSCFRGRKHGTGRV